MTSPSRNDSSSSLSASQSYRARQRRRQLKVDDVGWRWNEKVIRGTDKYHNVQVSTVWQKQALLLLISFVTRRQA